MLEPFPEKVKRIPIHYARKFLLVPCREGGTPVIAATDETPLEIVDEIRRLTGIREVRRIPPQEVKSLIDRTYEEASEEGEALAPNGFEKELEELTTTMERSTDLLESQDDAPVIRFVNSMLFRAIRQKASDIHIEPYETDFTVRNRIDGVLYPVATLPRGLHPAVVSRIKIMAGMDIAEKRLPQDGRIRVKVGEKDVDIRVSTVPTSFGERVVLRLLDRSSVLLELDDLGMEGDQLRRFRSFLRKTTGIILVTGPTGSGKTTTLYAAIRSLDAETKNIITIEDPVEYQIKGIGQIQVNPKINLTFASGLRSVLRQDPDIIMVGEIRDTETAEISIHASLTGHLVLSTLHTNDAPSAVTRLIDMGIEPFLISSSLECVIAQRLVRRLCPSCRVPYEPSREELDLLGITGASTFYRAEGCDECYGTGYRGRTGIFELLVISDDIKKLINEKADARTIREKAIEEGMVPLITHGGKKVERGITSVDEVIRVVTEKEV
ncbi:MAG: type II secretion system protein GspE [Deltaproteobacteria bacterium]|nr:MAG: type II secretion system protein GspE [Deltaproteobacteria bacterium]